MKRISLLLALLTALCFGSCGTPRLDPGAFTETIYAPAYATGFDIRGLAADSLSLADRSAASEAPTLITVRNPWQGASDIEQHLLVLRGDAEAPAAFDGTVVRAPVERVVCMSSGHIAFFDALGETDRISGVSGIDYISNPRIQENRQAGKVHDIGFDSNIDFERLASMRPGIVLLYGVTGENVAVTGKLRELGIPYVYVGDYVENSPLGKAEWLVAIAELCNRRETGADTLRHIAARYEALKAAPAAGRPKVMLNTPYRDTWFMPPRSSYMVRLVEDAGGAYIYPQNDTNASQPIDMEEAYLLARQADVWINVGGCNTLAELTAQNPKFADVPAVKERRVFNNNRRQTPSGGSDFWESGNVRPDRILRDLRTIFSGGNADSLWYYKRLE